MHYHKKIGALAMAFLIVGGLASIDARTILLVPQDDRPVSLDYTVSTAEKAGYTVLTPPKGYLSGKIIRAVLIRSGAGSSSISARPMRQ